MQDTQLLNSLYLSYSIGLLEKQRLETAVLGSIQDYIQHQPGLARNDHDDYISWVYPRISQAINNYRDTGSSFATYISSLVRLTVREFRALQIYSYTCESAAWVTQIPEMYTHDSEPEYGGYITVREEELAGLPEKIRNPRQLLILILKCCRYVSPDFIEKISSVLGMDPKVLGDMIETLKNERMKRESYIALFREKVNYQFFRCVFFESAVKRMAPDSITVQKYTKLLERGRIRLNNMRTRLVRLRSDPSNTRIAEMLGISKGTVDSTLYKLKIRYLRDQGKILLN